MARDIVVVQKARWGEGDRSCNGWGLRAVQSDDQLANRFEPFALPLWGDDDDFRRLLNTLEAVLPLRKRSDLDDPALANRIYAAGEGILGEIAIVMRARSKLSDRERVHHRAHYRGCQLYSSIGTSAGRGLIIVAPGPYRALALPSEANS